MAHRIGIGYDLHRTAPDRRLILGGIQLDAPFGLAGHSDADIVLHALTDALLGAIGGGDIGDLFPDTDPAFKDADSRQFLAAAMDRVAQAGFQVINVDVIIHAQRPKLGPHKRQIAENIAQLMCLSPESVCVKATTNEGLDAIGRGEALACWCAVLVEAA
jgi:2-C-methyl-D-erythritol 2,4-cyclodiphosphate synthase